MTLATLTDLPNLFNRLSIVQLPTDTQQLISDVELAQPLPSLGGKREDYAGFATAAVLLVMVMNWHPSHPAAPENRLEELELVAQQGSLEMYKDLDFYRWLAKNDAAH